MDLTELRREYAFDGLKESDLDDNPFSQFKTWFKNAIDAKVLCGNGASQRILQKIDMPHVDYFLALTPIDEINLIASKAAKTLGAKKIIGFSLIAFFSG